MEKIPYDIFARQEIKAGTDLKGKTIGVSTLTGGTTLMVHEVLEKAYRLNENDYKLLVVGTSPRSVTPLSRAVRSTRPLWDRRIISGLPKITFVNWPIFTSISDRFFLPRTSHI